MTCDACQIATATHHVEVLLWDWWGIEAGMPADLCDGCWHVYRARLAEEPT